MNRSRNGLSLKRTSSDLSQKRTTDGKRSVVPQTECVGTSSDLSQIKTKDVENKLCYKEGDLFSCPDTDALAHCISMDCKMGAGIAKIFKKKFKGVEELLEQKKEPGQCAVLKRDDRFVYYLVTKEKYNHKPTYRTLKQSLEAMKDHCVKNGVSRLSIPRIGCGLDKLCWNKVSLMIQDVFQNTDVVITVYLLKTTETTRRNK
ncbi:ADP-ribose glycohydrolase OARD1 isoform X2 [Trichomycterus rosablanca]|uniref:ADP-ribose glycohydrolase OARD1 isoform X2 n=1 Tax=Trichomycterus rosablanca TaxID=2290929 RepID=UPI002F35BA6D